ncbi:MAG: amidohydrolase family protein [Pseudomonadota bacterium]|nr:amidohydrolase family protein [Pseudomonadota bacterium]
MTATTCIRNADWVIGWDAGAESHQYLQGADVVFAGNSITFVGKGYDSAVDNEIDGAGRCVMPGLVDIHNHTSTMPVFKGVREELGNPRFYMSALYDGWNLFAPEPEDKAWNARFAYCELLLSGVTTAVDMCDPFPGWLEAMADSGLRGYLSPFYASARWYSDDGYRLKYEWAEDGGKAAFARAMALIDEAHGHNSGRLSAMVTPATIDTCTPKLLRDSVAAAEERDLPYQLHAGESMMEFLEMTRRHGKTQIQWLHELGILGPRTTIGHGIFLDHHSWLHWSSRDDIRLLAESGTSVAHCPTVFSRYGIALENLGLYLDAGINMGIGTDCHPHNMIEEMRHAAVVARLAAEDMYVLKTADVFHAATIGGAKALLRDDIGRLAPGAKADIVLIDVTDPAMRPVYDPLRCLIYTAADRVVRDVYVDGIQVVADHRVVNLDFDEAADHVTDTQRRILEKVPSRDHQGRRADQLSPLTFPLADG